MLALVVLVASILAIEFLINNDDSITHRPVENVHPCVHMVESKCFASENQSSVKTPEVCLDSENVLKDGYRELLEEREYSANNSRVTCKDS